MAKDAEDGFNRVLADEEGTFAFIHDASEVVILEILLNYGMAIIN